MTFYIDCEETEGLQLEKLRQTLGAFVQSDTPVVVELLFVDEAEIQALNNETRGIDKVTDVLSFPTLDGIKGKPIVGEKFPFDKDEEGRLVLGSIVICKARAKEQAEEYGHSTKENCTICSCTASCIAWGTIILRTKKKRKCANKKNAYLPL